MTYARVALAVVSCCSVLGCAGSDSPRSLEAGESASVTAATAESTAPASQTASAAPEPSLSSSVAASSATAPTAGPSEVAYAPLPKPLSKKRFKATVAKKPFTFKSALVLPGTEANRRSIEIFEEPVTCKDTFDGVVQGTHKRKIYVSLLWRERLSAVAARVTTIHTGSDGVPVSSSYQDEKPVTLVDLGSVGKNATIRLQFGEPDWDDYGDGELSAEVCPPRKD